MGGVVSASIVRAHLSSNQVTPYDLYVTSNREGEQLDYFLKKLGLRRNGAIALYLEFQRLDDIKAGDLTCADIYERLKVKDLSNGFMERVFTSFNDDTHAR